MKSKSFRSPCYGTEARSWNSTLNKTTLSRNTAAPLNEITSERGPSPENPRPDRSVGEERAAPPPNVTNPRREVAAAPARGAAGEETAAAAVAAAVAMRECWDAKEAKRRREARGGSVLWRCRRSICSRDGARMRRVYWGTGSLEAQRGRRGGRSARGEEGDGDEAGPTSKPGAPLFIACWSEQAHCLTWIISYFFFFSKLGYYFKFD